MTVVKKPSAKTKTNPVKSPAKAPAAKGKIGPQPGEKAPDFSLQNDQDKTVSLSDFKGKQVVLFFYPKDNTSGCTAEACDFRDNLSRISKSQAVVLGISADSVASHQKFISKQNLNFPLLSDPDHKALEAYGVWQEKSLYGRKFMGIVRTTFIIDKSGKISKVFPKVNVAGHVAEVLAAL